jgi:hypothetical protein
LHRATALTSSRSSSARTQRCTTRRRAGGTPTVSQREMAGSIVLRLSRRRAPHSRRGLALSLPGQALLAVGLMLAIAGWRHEAETSHTSP